MSFLSTILEATQKSVDAREREHPLEQLKAETKPRPDDRRFLHALHRSDGVAVIAEFKRSAPSSDFKHLDAVVGDYARTYLSGGASALSILTEDSQFHGSLRDLREARDAVDLPILRKDFVIGERQVYEAVKAGADAILLITAVLNDEELAKLHALARMLGLDVLVEIREESDLPRALRVGADLVGINNRNLATFDVDVETTRELVDKMPSGVTVVSESGLNTREQLDELAGRGVHAALIGSALMNATDTLAKCRELTEPGGTPRSSRSTSQPTYA
jgi:indole-3-glycerol phosphate synthase